METHLGGNGMEILLALIFLQALCSVAMVWVLELLLAELRKANREPRKAVIVPAPRNYPAPPRAVYEAMGGRNPNVIVGSCKRGKTDVQE